MKKKILIIDDETIITRALSRALEKQNYHIVTAHDGRKGFQAIIHEKPNLILLDIIMPGLTGIEVLEKMKKENIQIPTILMTAYGDTQTEKKAKELNVSAYLTKPFENIEDIVTLVRKKLHK